MLENGVALLGVELKVAFARVAPSSGLEGERRLWKTSVLLRCLNVYKLRFVVASQEAEESYLVSSEPTQVAIRPGEVHFSRLGLFQEQVVKVCTQQVLPFQPAPVCGVRTSDDHLEVLHR